MEPWLGFGFFLTGVASWGSRLWLGLRGATHDDGDLTLTGLKSLLDAQGSWITVQAEELVSLRRTTEEQQVRIVATEAHARSCDEQLAQTNKRLEQVNDFIKVQGIVPPWGLT